MPGPAEVRAYYPVEYYGLPGTKFQPAVERVVRWLGARHIAFLTRALAPGSRVLDVGCGRGVILGPLAELGYEAHGFEISEAAARGSDPRASIRVAPSLAGAGYEPASFDEVVIWHVLEHMEDPRGALEEVHRILVPGGRLVVAVPNFSSLQARFAGAAWFHLDLPRHLFHFPLPALRRLLTAAGFEIVSEHHFSLRQNPFGWIQSALNLCGRLPRNGLYALLRQRPAGATPPFRRATRFWLRAALVALTPPALAAVALETVLRTGATVHVVARRR